ncbi:hypothetical protein PIROE2DRAFT_2910 [Piromyces sp. E2]|nr:hypothetical protein PIROE2DRAFT_2910 [Piromyces sp. E2]|eukprot:OUM69209.1 hypothetical protein PIROE2DRAFT_2910 [Piromyces sp. E2]
MKINEKIDYSKSGSLKTKDSAREVNEQIFSIKSSSYTKNSSVSNETASNSFGIVDPILYFKKLHSIINKKITFYLVIAPVVVVLLYTIILTIARFDDMKKSCVNEQKLFSTPKFALNVVIITTSFYMFYQAYVKQRWDRELKYEYTTFVIVDLICTICTVLAVDGHLGETVTKYRVYIFQVYSAVVHFICIIEPLIKIFISSYFDNNKGKLSEEGFLMRLNNSTFKAQVLDIATHTFCIENVLFFDAHIDLMNMVINYYSKKNNIPPPTESVNVSCSYTSSDILHKNTINPSLYKPFDNVFKSQYEQIYNLYIKEDSIASINIKSSTIKDIEDQMENDNYSYLMFIQAAEEVGELLYNNIYPRMKI